jgi:meiosis-specific APC/C activator protein AMA1
VSPARSSQVNRLRAGNANAPPRETAVNNGHGQLLTSGTNALFFTTDFSPYLLQEDEHWEWHEGRIAAALNLDRAERLLSFSPRQTCTRAQAKKPKSIHIKKTTWNGSRWVSPSSLPGNPKATKKRIIPHTPFRVLDAPQLKDDFYCTPLAYSPTCRTLVVCLGNDLYSWTEIRGGLCLQQGLRDGSYLSSVAFSSPSGSKSILAFGRSNGLLSLMSLYDSMLPRFEVVHGRSIACLSWRPVPTIRPSKSPSHPGVPVLTEDLLVGDDLGNIFYYVVEWPSS